MNMAFDISGIIILMLIAHSMLKKPFKDRNKSTFLIAVILHVIALFMMVAGETDMVANAGEEGVGLYAKEHPQPQGRRQRQAQHAHAQHLYQQHVQQHVHDDVHQTGHGGAPVQALQGQVVGQLAAQDQGDEADHLAHQEAVEQRAHRPVLGEQPRQVEHRQHQEQHREQRPQQQRDQHVQREHVLNLVLLVPAQVLAAQYGRTARQHGAERADQQGCLAKPVQAAYAFLAAFVQSRDCCWVENLRRGIRQQHAAPDIFPHFLLIHSLEVIIDDDPLVKRLIDIQAERVIQDGMAGKYQDAVILAVHLKVHHFLEGQEVTPPGGAMGIAPNSKIHVLMSCIGSVE